MKIPVNTPYIGAAEKKYVNECLDTAWISSAGRFVPAFEEAFANYCGCEYGVSVTNGTSAIHLALKALDLQEGDEVIVPSFTMAGSVYPITQLGCVPVFIDCELRTFNMDIELLESKITDKTKAIMPVHIYGHPVDMDPILKLAKKYNLYVVEDAAEAHGALYKGTKVGCLGDIACFSFYANKIITTGEGGMVVSNNENLMERARRLKDLGHGKTRFTHDMPEAYNYRMTNIQAAIGLGQFERIEDIIERKINNAERYNQLLEDIADFQTPICEEWARNVYWMYGVLVKPDARLTKSEWMTRLAENGIETRSFFYPLDQQIAFKQYSSDDCPNTRYAGEHGFYLPSGQDLSEEQIKYIVEIIRQIYTQSSRK